MVLFSSKRFRSLVQLALFMAPKETRALADCWIRGRREYRELQKTNYVIVSLPKSGRTWLRAMISSYFQDRYGLAEGAIIGFDNFHKKNNNIPRILFTHDNVIRNYADSTRRHDIYSGKKVILLVRDPRDTVVSQFHQWKYRMSPAKRNLHSKFDPEADVSLAEYAFDPTFGIRRNIRFLNEWSTVLTGIKDHLVVRYEDARANPFLIKEVLEFLGESPSDAQIDSIVEFASFNNMHRREKENSFVTKSRRMFSGDSANPNTYKVRRGKVGGFVDYFTDEQIASIEEMIVSELNSVFGYNDAPDAQVSAKGS